MEKITLSPEAMAALNAGGAELKAPPKPLPMKAQRVIQERIAKTLLGPSMKPNFKQQLLTFPSYAAIKASWATDHFQRRYRERTRN